MRGQIKILHKQLTERSKKWDRTIKLMLLLIGYMVKCRKNMKRTVACVSIFN